MNTESVNIFANPIAGRGKGKAIAARLETALRAEGYIVKTSFDRPQDLPAGAIDDTTRALIVIGGDGTIRAVAGRVLALRGSIPPILPIPLGTANLMVHHLGFKWTDQTMEAGVCQAIRQLRIRTIDSASANGSMFLLMAGIGFDAQVVHELDRIRKGPIHMLSYLKPAAMALRDYHFPALRVAVDGTVVWRYAPAVAFVGNVKEYGVGFSVLPFANPGDGLLDVCVMPCQNWFELTQWFLQAAAGQHVWSDKIKYLNGKHIVIESKSPVPVQLDGDAGGHTPLDIRLLPQRVPFIVPG
ncbi:MAG TPA: diacylglycerol kinase family protein [Tepidisphaeraceae bacterium]|nr:diacylglycerol kinase family protein [Tepidisphaeraceae bacterium]